MPSPFWHPAFIIYINLSTLALKSHATETTFAFIKLIVLKFSLLCYFRWVAPPFIPALRSSIYSGYDMLRLVNLLGEHLERMQMI